MKRILLLPQQIIPGYFISASYIRIIDPFKRLADANSDYKIFTRESYDGGDYDAVVIERIYRDDFTVDELYELVGQLRRKKIRIIFAIDDDYYNHFIEGQDSEKNLRQLSVVCTLARLADAVICSTDALGETLRNYNPDVHVFPNFLSRKYLKGFGSVPSSGKDNGGIDIGYMGTLTHLSDFKIAANALKAIMHEYSDVRLHVVGIADGKVLRKIMYPYELVVHKMPKLSILLDVFYPWFVKKINWDIGLAPLTNTKLNQCKSDLKLLDYSAIGAAGVYTRITPYADLEERGLGVVVDNTDEDWYDGIKRLIDNAKQRHQIQISAQDYLMQHRIMEDNINLMGSIVDRILN